MPESLHPEMPDEAKAWEMAHAEKPYQDEIGKIKEQMPDGFFARIFKRGEREAVFDEISYMDQRAGWKADEVEQVIDQNRSQHKKTNIDAFFDEHHPRYSYAVADKETADRINKMVERDSDNIVKEIAKLTHTEKDIDANGNPIGGGKLTLFDSSSKETQPDWSVVLTVLDKLGFNTASKQLEIRSRLDRGENGSAATTGSVIARRYAPEISNPKLMSILMEEGLRDLDVTVTYSRSELGQDTKVELDIFSIPMTGESLESKPVEVSKEEEEPDLVERSLEHAPVKSVEYLGGGISRTYVVVLEDGKKAVFKPGSESDADVEERSAYLVSRAIGFDIVPPTVIRELESDRGRERGSLQQLVEGSTMSFMEREAAVQAHREGLVKMWLFDLMIQNQDRHGGNYLLAQRGVVAIDHNKSFDFRRSQYNIAHSFVGEALPVEVIESLKRASEDEESLSELADRLTSLLGKGIAEVVIERIKTLTEVVLKKGLVDNDDLKRLGQIA